jgi:DNA-binding IclR family transcriptional regulator
MMISRELDMPRSTTYHLLNVLRQRGFVAYHDETRRWGIGAKAVEIAAQAPSLSQGVMALESFGRASESLTLEEVAQRSGLSASVTGRVLAQLQTHGLVTASNGRFALGLRLAVLAARIGPVDQLRTTARPFLIALRDETGETANLLVRDGNKAVYLEQIESRHTLRHAGWVGLQVPLKGTAAGAAMERADGAEVVRDGVEPGVTAIAFPVQWPMLVAAIGITGPTTRLDARAIARAKKTVARTAQALSKELADAEPRRRRRARGS